jgi:hypothetical protein
MSVWASQVFGGGSSVPPAPPSGWDVGAATGTLVGDVWTPALGPGNRVNAASVALIPPSTWADVKWVEVAGTRLDTLNSDVLAAQPGWTARGGGNPWTTVLDNYSGLAWDAREGTERAFTSASGGHFDGSNDGSYLLDFRRMLWDVQQYPWNQTYMDPAYKIPDIITTTGSFTGYALAANYYTAAPGNAEGVYGDEFFDPAHPTDPNYSPRRPTARHQYSAQVFVPELGVSGRLIFGTRRYWELDLATSWLTPKFPFGDGATYNDITGYSGQYCAGFWDEVEQRYYFGPTQGAVAGGGHRWWSCQSGGTGWRDEGYYPIGGELSEFVAYQKIDRTLWMCVYKDTGERTTKPIEVREVDLDTRAITTHALTLGASLSGKTWPSGDYDFGPGMTWCSWVSRWLISLRTVEDGFRWAWIDPATWTVDLAVNMSGAVAQPHQRMLSKVQALDGAGLLAHVHVGNQNIRVARFA